MTDPVFTFHSKDTKQAYERKDIVAWLKDHNTDPATNKTLTSVKLKKDDKHPVTGKILEEDEEYYELYPDTERKAKIALYHAQQAAAKAATADAAAAADSRAPMVFSGHAAVAAAASAGAKQKSSAQDGEIDDSQIRPIEIIPVGDCQANGTRKYEISWIIQLRPNANSSGIAAFHDIYIEKTAIMTLTRDQQEILNGDLIRRLIRDYIARSRAGSANGAAAAEQKPNANFIQNDDQLILNRIGPLNFIRAADRTQTFEIRWEVRPPHNAGGGGGAPAPRTELRTAVVSITQDESDMLHGDDSDKYTKELIRECNARYVSIFGATVTPDPEIDCSSYKSY